MNQGETVNGAPPAGGHEWGGGLDALEREGRLRHLLHEARERLQLTGAQISAQEAEIEAERAELAATREQLDSVRSQLDSVRSQLEARSKSLEQERHRVAELRAVAGRPPGDDDDGQPRDPGLDEAMRQLDAERRRERRKKQRAQNEVRELQARVEELEAELAKYRGPGWRRR